MEYKVNGHTYSTKNSTFPGGEEFVATTGKLPLDGMNIEILADLRSSKEVIQLLMLTDILKRYANRDAYFTLNLGYLPYARQDRLFKRESFSLKVFCNLINSLGFDKVLVSDCHSEVGLALLNNVKHKTQLQCLSYKKETHNLAHRAEVIVAPDAGAAKKAQEIADYYGKPMVQCLKTRVGDTISIQVLGDITGKVALVVDDICDGGGTFLALAGALAGKAPKELNLYVTHGIFSKGKDILLKAYDKVEAYSDWTA